MSDAPGADDAADAIEALAALKACGADRFRPVRVRFIEALARRAALQQGEARRLLEARLQQLIAEHAQAFAQREPASAPEAVSHPLAELTARLSPPVANGLHGDVRSAPPELKTLQEFRSTWRRLTVDRRLTQSLAQVPTQAGPLNSQHLIHQALSLMRELSPAYLDRFIGHVDALLWLDQVSAGAAPPGAEGGKPEAKRKPARAPARPAGRS